MVHPDLLNGWNYGSSLAKGEIPAWNILGFSIEKVGYQGTVLPVLAASFILAKIEQSLRKIMPSALDNLLTPLLTVAIASAYITFYKTLAIAPGAAGVPGIISIRPDSVLHYMIGMIISFIVAFGLTIVLSKKCEIRKMKIITIILSFLSLGGT